MKDIPYGRVILGDEQVIRASCSAMAAMQVDQEMLGEEPDAPVEETTIGAEVAVTGPGTFFGRAQRTLVFAPSRERGWWFQRRDLSEAMPILVSVRNVWTTQRNIVLCSGSPHNYMRMVEHIVALRLGMGLDSLVIKVDSGDPPLFDRSSMDLVEAVERAGIVKLPRKEPYVTVKEPVTVGGANGSFVTFLPAADGRKTLTIDCAIDFKSAIGRQRIKFVVNRNTFRHGAAARTNSTLGMMLYCKTIGKIFADTRNLGYTMKNILIAGPRRYCNTPLLLYKGKSLEAAWHRAVLDLLAAVALIDMGRFAGSIVSFKAGHALDVNMIKELYDKDLICPL